MDEKNDQAELSIIVVVGDCRERAQRMFAAIAAQSVADRIELIIVDAASDGAPALELPAGFRIKQARVAAGILPGSARFEGTKFAATPVVAYLEDHCFPDKDWASAIIEAHQGDCTAVGYTFVNGSPDTYLYRAVFLAEYGQWARPHTRGKISRLPGSNVSYKKGELLRFGERLEELFEMEYLLHESLRNCGSKFCIEPKAVVFHECYASFSGLLYSHFLFSRLQAARRAQVFAWNYNRRLIRSLGAPFVLPWLQLYRAWKVLRTHSLSNAWLRSIPIIYLIHQCEAIGESLGLLAGAGNSSHRFAPRELNGARIARQS